MTRMPSEAKAGWLWGPYSRLGLTFALASIVIDQAHKWWMLEIYRIQDRGRVQVLPFFDLVFVKNEGISYGLGAGRIGQVELALMAVVVSLAMVVWLARGEMNKLMAVSIGLIIGGAVGNAIDRVVLGGVADFFLLYAFGFSWYVFNLADVAIVAGVIGLLYDSFIPSRNGASK